MGMTGSKLDTIMSQLRCHIDGDVNIKMFHTGEDDSWVIQFGGDNADWVAGMKGYRLQGEAVKLSQYPAGANITPRAIEKAIKFLAHWHMCLWEDIEIIGAVGYHEGNMVVTYYLRKKELRSWSLAAEGNESWGSTPQTMFHGTC